MEARGMSRGPWRGPSPEMGAPFGRGRRGHHGGHAEGPPAFVPGGRGGWRQRGPNGPGGRPPFDGGHERRFGHRPHAGRGDVRAAVLALLAEAPLHGYQIIQQIAERSGGDWRPSPGSVYPALQLLEDEGLIQAEQVDTRRVFHLTESGRAYVQGRQTELAGIWKTVSGGGDEGRRDLRDLFQQVGAALMQVARAGSKEEIAQARDLLTNTRRQLYQILAGSAPPAPGQGQQDAGGTVS